MKILKHIPKLVFMLALLVVSSCKEDLTEINENPNGVDPNSANPNLIMPTVMTGVANQYVRLGYGKIAGVVQHTQEDAWKMVSMITTGMKKMMSGKRGMAS